ncbi:hypothetical protein PMIN06_001388 [Paraphaeosphaeria minitans]
MGFATAVFHLYIYGRFYCHSHSCSPCAFAVAESRLPSLCRPREHLIGLCLACLLHFNFTLRKFRITHAQPPSEPAWTVCTSPTGLTIAPAVLKFFINRPALPLHPPLHHHLFQASTSGS